MLETRNNRDVEIHLVHCKQRFDWDCGIACVLMVLSDEDRQHFLDHFEEICEWEEFGKSTWTIDLCYLLQRFKVDHIFYTLTLGVQRAYKAIGFYKIYIKDEVRVNLKFDKALERGLRIKKAQVNLEGIVNHLRKYGPVLVLINANTLQCVHCEKSKFRWFKSSYQGHYIVACGYNLYHEVIHYRNPAKKNQICSVKFDCFEKSRTCFGTDEDIIFIYNK